MTATFNEPPKALSQEAFLQLFANQRRPSRERIAAAYWMAGVLHEKTPPRDDGSPYFTHPVRVAATLCHSGYNSSEYAVLGLLHDAIEESDAPRFIYEHVFGEETVDSLSLLSKKENLRDPCPAASSARR
jgi:(p)ppGpp synthase/HD superfamily hydrolase